MACTEVQALAQRLSLDAATLTLAEQLVTGERLLPGRFAPHCAVLVSSLRTGHREVHLREVWAGETEVEVNEFFRTLEGAMERWEVEPAVRGRLVEVYHSFEFEYTFFRKFEELWVLMTTPTDVIGAEYRQYSWLLFLSLRVLLVPQQTEIVKTALVLLGTLMHVSTSELTWTKLSDRLKLTTSEAASAHSQVVSAVATLESTGALKKSVRESIPALDRFIAGKLAQEAVDPREFLVPNKVKVVQCFSQRNPVATPISQRFETESWLASLHESEEALLGPISLCCVPVAHYTVFVQRLQRFKEVLAASSDFGGGEKHRGGLVVTVYLKQLVTLIETKRKSLKETDFWDSFSSESFHKSMFAVSIESALFAHSLVHVSFEDVLSLADISPFDFWKGLKSVSLDSFFPRSIKRHFHLIEEKIVTSMAWVKRGPVENVILALENDSTPSEDEGEERRDRIPTPYGVFFKQVAKFAARRVSDLCEKLMLEESVAEKVWSAVKYLLSEETEILINKHVDQIILCAVYGVCEGTKAVTWPDLISSYSDLNPSELSLIARPVRTSSSTLSIDRFYTNLVKPRLRERHSSQQRSDPRIKELSPAESLREMTTVLGTPMTKHFPMKSPFRDTGLTPTSQRLYGPVAAPAPLPSDKRINFNSEEDRLGEIPEHLKQILSSKPSLQLPVFERKEK